METDIERVVLKTQILTNMVFFKESAQEGKSEEFLEEIMRDIEYYIVELLKLSSSDAE